MPMANIHVGQELSYICSLNNHTVAKSG